MNATVDPNFWNALADRYAARPVQDPEAFDRKTAITRALVEPNHTVLDIGCGTGSFCLRLASTGADIHGLDLSDQMLRIARDKARAAEVDNVTFHVGPFDDSLTAFASESLDGAFAYSLLHLVPDRKAALAQIYRLLKPGGYFVASTVCLGESWIPYALVLRVMRWLGRAPYLDARLSRASLHREVQSVGFEDVQAPDVGAKPIIDFLVARKPSR
ncbi:MAG: class I SAM-dependent methyltransferase [Nannocystaceae bacterium]|nr:class I SAM-dependent methyltransferase [bacterium]